MLEVIIERWTARDGAVDFRWSLWRDGRRIQMGGPHSSGELSEASALEFCRKTLDCPPDRITRL